MGQHLPSTCRWALGLIPNTAKQKNETKKEVALCLFYVIYIRENRNLWYLPFKDGRAEAEKQSNFPKLTKFRRWSSED